MLLDWCYSMYLTMPTDPYKRYVPIDGVSMFDFKGVISDVDEGEGIDLGIALEHLAPPYRDYTIFPLIVSYARKDYRQQEILARGRNWSGFRKDVPGVIFTDEKHEMDMDQIRVYKARHLQEFDTVIQITGNKGHAAQLFRAPSLLFDDQNVNLNEVKRLGYAGSSGHIVPCNHRRSGDQVTHSHFRACNVVDSVAKIDEWMVWLQTHGYLY